MVEEEKGLEKIKPVLHTYDDKYTDLEIEWNHQKLRIQTTANNNDLDILITPLNINDSIQLRVHPKIIWQGNGKAVVTNTQLLFTNKNNDLTVYLKGIKNQENKNYISFSFDEPIYQHQN